MEIIRRNVRVSIGEKIYIAFLGDNHEGAENHAKECLIRAVKDIKKIAQSGHFIFVVGMGDYIDAINHKDPRFNPVEIARSYNIKDLKDLPKRQMQEFITDVEPIIPNFIAWLYGNHEENYVRWNGADPMGIIEDYYNYKYKKSMPILGYDGWIELGIIRDKDRPRPNQVIRIKVNHGTGGGGFREGYPINKVHDIFRWDLADIYCMGHLHQMSSDVTIKKTTKFGEEYKTKHLYGSNGCFILKSKKGSRGYFEGRPGKYSGIGFLVAEITVAKKKNKTGLRWIRYDYK